MTPKSKTKKATSRKGSAGKKSAAVERYNTARENAQNAVEMAGEGSYHETAGRITLVLMDARTAPSTRCAIEQALEELAELTGVGITHPTVVCETYPTMEAAVSSGETWESKQQGESAEERLANLLDLLSRAEAGEVLPDPDETESATQLHYAEQVARLDAKIERAEANNCWDTITAGERAELKALALYDLLSCKLPNFLTAAIMSALDAAAKSKGLELAALPDGEAKAEGISKIEKILTMAFDYKPTEPNSRAALAAHVAAIMTNPHTPTGLYNAVGEEVTDWSTDYCNEYSNTPAYIEQCLVSHLKKEDERKGGAQ
jgi:hypothetical protein